MSIEEFLCLVHNIVPHLREQDIFEAVTRLVDRSSVIKVKAVTPLNSKSSNFMIQLTNETTQKRLFNIRRLYVKEYVLRMEPPPNHPDLPLFRRQSPPRLKLLGLPLYSRPCDLKELCVDAKAVFWELPWSNRLKRYENYAIVEFDHVDHARAALVKPISLDGKHLTWQELGNSLSRASSSASPVEPEGYGGGINFAPNSDERPLRFTVENDLFMMTDERRDGVVGGGDDNDANDNEIPKMMEQPSIGGGERFGKGGDDTLIKMADLPVSSSFLGAKRKLVVVDAPSSYSADHHSSSTPGSSSNNHHLKSHLNSIIGDTQQLYQQQQLEMMEKKRKKQDYSEADAETGNLILEKMDRLQNQLNQIYSVLVLILQQNSMMK